MDFKHNDSKSSGYAMLFIQLIACVAIFFNIPVVRQVTGFIYFTIIPGFVITKLLKLELGKLETILFSVGLSIAFLMLTGLFINECGPFFGLSQPLSLIPLMISLNSLVFMGEILVYLRKGNLNFSCGNLDKKFLFTLPLFCLPILSVIGAMFVGVNGNNLILLCMMVAISLLFVVGVIFEKRLAPLFYPTTIFMIAVALLYHSSLISSYITLFGSDVGGEYFTFKITENIARWSSTNPYLGGSWKSFGRLNSMLSITVLPTIYSNLLNIISINLRFGPDRFIPDMANTFWK
jgi:uncharacterized membrane protein